MARHSSVGMEILFIPRFFAVNILSNVIRYREERTWKNSDLYALFYSTTFTQDEIRPIESSTIIQRERGRVVRTELITKWRGGGIHCIAWKNFLCRRLVCEPGARRIQPVTTLSLGRRIACLIDSPDANLEIRGDVVSSGSGARDLSRPFARYPLWK